MHVRLQAKDYLLLMATLLAVLASVRLWRRYGRLRFIEFSGRKWLTRGAVCGARRRRHQELRLGRASQLPRGCLQILANAERRSGEN